MICWPILAPIAPPGPDALGLRGPMSGAVGTTPRGRTPNSRPSVLSWVAESLLPGQLGRQGTACVAFLVALVLADGAHMGRAVSTAGKHISLRAAPLPRPD